MKTSPAPVESITFSFVIILYFISNRLCYNYITNPKIHSQQKSVCYNLNKKTLQVEDIMTTRITKILHLINEHKKIIEIEISISNSLINLFFNIRVILKYYQMKLKINKIISIIIVSILFIPL